MSMYHLVKKYEHSREYLVKGVFLLVSDCRIIDNDELNVHYSDGNGQIIDCETLVELREEWGDILNDETALLYVQCLPKDIA